MSVWAPVSSSATTRFQSSAAARDLRYGYRQILVLLRREGWPVNARRTYRRTSTPEPGVGLSPGHRDGSLGWRLGLAGGRRGALEPRLEATRSEATGAIAGAEPEQGIGLHVTARW